MAIHALIQSVSYGFIEGLKVQIPLWHSGFSRRIPIVVVIVGIPGGRVYARSRHLPARELAGLRPLEFAGYDLPHRINADIVETLIKWISDIPCFELHYSELDQAVDQILKLMTE